MKRVWIAGNKRDFHSAMRKIMEDFKFYDPPEWGNYSIGKVTVKKLYYEQQEVTNV